MTSAGSERPSTSKELNAIEASRREAFSAGSPSRILTTRFRVSTAPSGSFATVGYVPEDPATPTAHIHRTPEGDARDEPVPPEDETVLRIGDGCRDVSAQKPRLSIDSRRQHCLAL